MQNDTKLQRKLKKKSGYGTFLNKIETKSSKGKMTKLLRNIFNIIKIIEKVIQSGYGKINKLLQSENQEKLQNKKISQILIKKIPKIFQTIAEEKIKVKKKCFKTRMSV